MHRLREAEGREIHLLSSQLDFVKGAGRKEKGKRDGEQLLPFSSLRTNNPRENSQNGTKSDSLPQYY